MKVSTGIAWVSIIGMLCAGVGCNDDGTGGEDATGSSTSASTSASTGSSSSSTSSATTGSTASSSSSSSSGMSDPYAVDCSAFPATIDLPADNPGGPPPNSPEAILCFDPATKACRLTTWTYIDGPYACDPNDVVVRFTLVETPPPPTGVVKSDETKWVYDSCSAGTKFNMFPDYYDIPVGQDVTLAMHSIATGDAYQIVFQFNAGTLTLQSVVHP